MSYIGSTPQSQNFVSGTDYFNGTGSQTAFALTRAVNSVNDIEVVINNVVQQPNTAYTISGTTITFTSAPSSGTANIYVRYLSTSMQSFTVPNNSITRNHLDSNLQAGFQGRNRIINGHMVVNQRGASVTANTSTSGTYVTDRFREVVTAGTGVFTIAQDTSAPVGFINSLKATVTTTYTVTGTDRYEVSQLVEGLNIADLGWGTADAKTVTVSFWTKSSLTGVFGGVVQNANADYNYVFSYTINAANTWEYKTITIVGPTTGTWATDNTQGLKVTWSLGCGSTRLGTTGAWSATRYEGATGQTQFIANTAATWFLTGVQLEEGTTATSFEREAYSITLQKCQRYYYLFASGDQVPTSTGTYYSATQVNIQIPLAVTMRSSPTLEVVSGASYYRILSNGASSYVSSYTLDRASTTIADIYTTSASGTAGYAVFGRTANASAKIAFSSEL